MSASSFAHSPFASRSEIFSSSAAFCDREKVRQKAPSKRATSGVKMCRSCNGRKPPSSSETPKVKQLLQGWHLRPHNGALYMQRWLHRSCL